KKAVFSDNYYRIFGLKPQSLPSNQFSFANFIHPEDQQMVKESYEKMRREHLLPDLDYRIIRNDGKTRYIRQRNKILPIGGELVIIGVIHDISGQKQLEKKVKDLSQEVSLGKFTYHLTEEIAGVGSW